MEDSSISCGPSGAQRECQLRGFMRTSAISTCLKKLAFAFKFMILKL